MMVTGASDNPPAAPKLPQKTPMYAAMHAERYTRQALIRQIEEQTGRVLICYVAEESIVRDDALPFVDLLRNLPDNPAVDLLLHTPGGDVDAAEKLISLLHQAVGKGTLRVIVPDFAKSAGTLMALGAHKIVMSDASELGPIDPQIVLDDGKGNKIAHSVQCHLDAYKEHRDLVNANPGDVAAHIMLSKLEPATLKVFENVIKRAQKFAEDQLCQWMFHNKKRNFTKIAAQLLDTKQWQSHGQMIGWQEAQRLELEVEFVGSKTPLWTKIWQLYLQQRLAIKDGQKLFESNVVSLVLE